MPGRFVWAASGRTWAQSLTRFVWAASGRTWAQSLTRFVWAASGRTWAQSLPSIAIRERQPKENNTVPRKTINAAEQSRQNLADALAVERERVQEHAAAVEGSDALDLRLEANDASVTEEEMVYDSVRVRRTTTLLAAARAEVKRARAAVINDDDELAIALVEPLGKALGVEPVPTCTHPTGVPTSLPAAFLLQSSPSSVNLRTGAIGGDLTLIWYGDSALHVMPTDRRISPALAAAGIRCGAIVSTGSGSHGEGVISTRFNLERVSGAFPAVPVLANEQTAGSLKAAKYLVQEAVETSFELAVSMHDRPRPAAAPLASRNERLPIVVTSEPPQLVSDTTTASGERSTTVELESTARPVEWTRTTAAAVYERRDSIAASMVGKVAPGLGRCTAADVVRTQAPEKGDGLVITWRLRFVSCLPSGQSEPAPVMIPPQTPRDPQFPASDPRTPLFRPDPMERSAVEAQHPGAVAH